MELGPQSHTYPDTFPKPLLQFIQNCTTYIGNLAPFKQYIIWRYTIGSASINTRLIFGKLSDNSKYWCYLFFKYANNTFGNDTSYLTKYFKKYSMYFSDPESFNKLATEKQIEDILNLYTGELYGIIVSGPRPKKAIQVFKVASKYPGLPDPLDFQEASVPQVPFNSTTIDPHFNFALFVSKETLGDGKIGCCLFDIVIPKGVPCLYIPKEYHAYPWENEVLLPPNSIFNIKSAMLSTLNYVFPDDINIVKVQNPQDIVMGPVYEVDTYKPCKYQSCMVRKKPFYTFLTMLSGPFTTK